MNCNGTTPKSSTTRYFREARAAFHWLGRPLVTLASTRAAVRSAISGLMIRSHQRSAPELHSVPLDDISTSKSACPTLVDLRRSDDALRRLPCGCRAVSEYVSG